MKMADTQAKGRFIVDKIASYYLLLTLFELCKSSLRSQFLFPLTCHRFKLFQQCKIGLPRPRDFLNSSVSQKSHL